ncbi:MAG TPA: hypothetical protein VK497_02760 [Candidatus Saccharimonadales bacterium]|nr:hypothetical protein [Candidatus Saccharimonadales bacterium]
MASVVLASSKRRSCSVAGNPRAIPWRVGIIRDTLVGGALYGGAEPHAETAEEERDAHPDDDAGLSEDADQDEEDT